MAIPHSRGVALDELIAGGQPMPLALALAIARQSLRAIGELRDNAVVHREVAPDNLMLSRDVGGRPRVKLVNVGISGPRLPTTGGDRSAGPGVGKLRYAAPEYLDDSAGGDRRRADVYAFSLVLYELLTGRYPISGNTAAALIAGHLFRPPLPFAESDPVGLIPEAVRGVVMKAMAKAPVDRFADAASFAIALRGAATVDLETPEVRGFLDRVLGENRPRGEPAPAAEVSRLEPPRPEPPRPEPPRPESPAIDGDADATVSLKPPAVSSPPPSPRQQAEELVSWGRSLTRTESFAEARTFLRRALEVDPTHPEGLALLASVEKELRVDEEQVGAETVRVTPGSLPESGTQAEEATHRMAAPHPPALVEALAAVRALRDEGKAGAALERLNRVYREFGPLEVLHDLRSELGQALLDRDAAEQSVSRMFQATAETAGGGVRAAAPRPATPPPAAPPPAAPRPAAPPSPRSFSEATIRSFPDSGSPPQQPIMRRPGLPVADTGRTMVIAALIVVVVFGLLVVFISRQDPATDLDPQVAAQDIEAAELRPGEVAIDAAPWAEIVSIEELGSKENPPITPSRFTPVVLSLPPGGYRITLRYPPTGQIEKTDLVVASGERVVDRIVFESLDAKQYFEQMGW